MHEWMGLNEQTSDWASEWARHSECATQCGHFKWIYFYCRRFCFFLLAILLVFFLPSIFHLLPFISRTSISVALSLALRSSCICLISVSINEIYVLCIMRTFVFFSLFFFWFNHFSLSPSHDVWVFFFLVERRFNWFLLFAYIFVFFRCVHL